MVLSCLIALTVLLNSPLKQLEAVELKEVKLGETVALMCNLSFYSDIHWLKMSEGQLMALMVTSLKHTGELSVVWNYNETHFEGFMEKQTNGLRILHISTSDLTTYYCATLYQKRLNFDKGVQLYSKCEHLISQEINSEKKIFKRNVLSLSTAFISCKFLNV
uniref:Ig-like domain-containing protein n=1 Tax=Sinocyclocheilus grahami TaxID=75366 RepID=A0A672Q8E7_SINGR